MPCPRCRADLPDAAHYCHVCGQDVRSGDVARRRSFAVKPDEPVVSFALVSTIMPRGANSRPGTYRVAFTITLVGALLAAIFGALPIAVMLAAFAIPIIYIVYLYDVNLWEDEPIAVTVMAFVLTAVLGALWTVAWLAMRGPAIAVGLPDGGGASPPLLGFLLTAILVPIVGEIIRQIGPVYLASRPKFDDLMDGLTFGIISGVGYATADTLVKQWGLLTSGFVGSQDAATWASLIFLEGFVKPLVMGTATGIACAEFSGLGEGYDGFTPRYYRGVAEAIGYNILYSAGTYLFSFLGNPVLGFFISILWGLLILAVLIIRVRSALHHGLMEAVLEHKARAAGVGPTGQLSFCAACEMPLLPDAAFCSACGQATRTAAKTKVAAMAGTPSAHPAPSTQSAPVAGPTPVASPGPSAGPATSPEAGPQAAAVAPSTPDSRGVAGSPEVESPDPARDAYYDAEEERS